MKSYRIVPFKTGIFSGPLDPKKLEAALNSHSAEGWKLTRSIHETTRVVLFFARETHFLIFEKDQ